MLLSGRLNNVKKNIIIEERFLQITQIQKFYYCVYSKYSVNSKYRILKERSPIC